MCPRTPAEPSYAPAPLGTPPAVAPLAPHLSTNKHKAPRHGTPAPPSTLVASPTLAGGIGRRRAGAAARELVTCLQPPGSAVVVPAGRLVRREQCEDSTQRIACDIDGGRRTFSSPRGARYSCANSSACSMLPARMSSMSCCCCRWKKSCARSSRICKTHPHPHLSCPPGGVCVCAAGMMMGARYLRVEVVDALDGVLDVPTLHRLADGRAVGDTVQVHSHCGCIRPAFPRS